MARWVDVDDNPCVTCSLFESCIPWSVDTKCNLYDNWYKGADVAPVKHGNWIKDTDTTVGGYICSKCYRWIPPIRDANFCPRCGAKMKDEG